ncbi:MlaD family protein [Gordonia terrae]|uniref:MlaD family protein n=1 Tax=Gordonia terrae TaxID=2055 RepID=UPI0015DED6F5|nr:MlaD family protein [Gordonia terrae]
MSAHQRAIGLGALIVTAVVVAATVLVYLRPPGQQTVSFVTDDAVSIKQGLDVRVAGVSVGSVESVELGADEVEVTTKIDDHVFIGDNTSVQVRMLTAVGGYFVTLVPAGNSPLGSKVIPSAKVVVPYSISDVLQEAPRITGEVRARELDANIQQVSRALTSNSSSVGSMIQGLDSIATIMDQQREQVSTTLDLAQDYLATFTRDREFLFNLIKKIERVLTRYNATWAGFNETYNLLGEVVDRISPLTWFYYHNKEELKAAVTTLRNGFRSIQEDMNPMIDQLTAILDGLRKMAGPGGVRKALGGVVLASDVCVPVPGKRC